MSDIRIVRDYPHIPAKVWRAVTDPVLIPLWTSTGQGARPEGFSATVGTRFRFVLLAKIVLGPARKKMLRVGLTAVLNDVDDDGALRPASALKPKSLG